MHWADGNSGLSLQRVMGSHSPRHGEQALTRQVPCPATIGLMLIDSAAPLAPGDLRCFNLRGNTGRNVITGPGLTSLDFSVFKNNYIKSISERFNIQIRAEIFNILN